MTNRLKPDGRKCRWCDSTNTTKAGSDAYRCQDCWGLTVVQVNN